MREEDIPDHNIFMMCESVDRSAYAPLPAGLSVRNPRADELDVWLGFPFDSPDEARSYRGFMTDFFARAYAGRTDELLRRTLFVCDAKDQPIATCSTWKTYDRFESIHWLKTKKRQEGRGVGRALFSQIMDSFSVADYPVFLHTQPGSFRAIKLYSDFGFKLLSDPKIGSRRNGLEESMPILRQFVPARDFERLRIASAPIDFLESLKDEGEPQF